MSNFTPSGYKFRTARKFYKGQIPGNATRGYLLHHGDFGIKILEPAKITPQQIETVRRVIIRETKRVGKIFIRIFPDRPVSRKPQEVRMGGGKGPFDHWVYVAKPGTILFEFGDISKELAYNAFKAASYKIGAKVKFIEREIWE